MKFISTINNLGVNELSNVALGQGNIILQVTDKKAVKDKYKVAVIKRAVEFSKETYNKAYNEFSQFIAANPTVDKVAANAEESGYNCSKEMICIAQNTESVVSEGLKKH